ncbi:MAG: DoxX family membrane protein [Proteobacteria bacterium]|nr:DoxX family membrane protein [Pseudomonadota bacterium]
MQALLKADSRHFFLTTLRLFFGSWLLYVGVSKLLGGMTGFIGYIEGEFAQTWLPSIAITTTAWLILILEPVIGAWLLLGKHQRLAWLSAASLMFLLMLGKTVLRDFPTVANNWQYLLLCLVAAAWSKPQAQ